MGVFLPRAAFGDQQQIVEEEQVEWLVELTGPHGPCVVRSCHLLHFTFL